MRTEDIGTSCILHLLHFSVGGTDFHIPASVVLAFISILGVLLDVSTPGLRGHFLEFRDYNTSPIVYHRGLSVKRHEEKLQYVLMAVSSFSCSNAVLGK